SATVRDAALTATGPVIQSIEGQRFSGPVATFADANSGGVAGDYTAVIAWGDGSTSTGTVVADGSGFTVVGAHVYAAAGSFAVSVDIRDAGGASAAAVVQAVVADAPLTMTVKRITATEGQAFLG